MFQFPFVRSHFFLFFHFFFNIFSRVLFNYFARVLFNTPSCLVFAVNIFLKIFLAPFFFLLQSYTITIDVNVHNILKMFSDMCWEKLSARVSIPIAHMKARVWNILWQRAWIARMNVWEYNFRFSENVFIRRTLYESSLIFNDLLDNSWIVTTRKLLWYHEHHRDW